MTNKENEDDMEMNPRLDKYFLEKLDNRRNTLINSGWLDKSGPWKRDPSEEGNFAKEIYVSLPDKARTVDPHGTACDETPKEHRHIFSQMATLHEASKGDMEWRQTARWVKFEEKVEDGGQRWSKPHVASVSLYSLFELRNILLNGTLIFDLVASDQEMLVEAILQDMIAGGKIPAQLKDVMQDILTRKHQHLYEIAKPKRRESRSNSIPFIFKNLGSNLTINTSDDGGQPYKGNKNFMRKIAPGSEASNILVGGVSFLKSPVSAFVRLGEALLLEEMTEVPVPTRFIYIILGPKEELSRYQQVGRVMAVLLSDENSTNVFYKVRDKTDLMIAIDDFMESVTVLPPATWNPSIRIEPPEKPPLENEPTKHHLPGSEESGVEIEDKNKEEAGLVRSGRLFGGLINDLKRKKPFYWSDFKDGLSVQSIAAVCFMYFACLSPIVTFGGLLGEATENNIAAIESLVSGLICGVVYGFMSGQPLTILGSTGPILVFESILFNFCKYLSWNYLELRVWVGLWLSMILFVLVAIDASWLVCFITRFTEENFAALIALIFIFEAVEKVVQIGSQFPLETQVDVAKWCNCTVGDVEYNVGLIRSGDFSTFSPSALSHINESQCNNMNGTLVGDGCIHYYPDVYTLSLFLFFGTFFISMGLKYFKTTSFFPAKVRSSISDFAVIIAIVVMTIIDYSIGIHTPKLQVPEEFKPTNPNRGWIIYPFGDNPWWSTIAAAAPALLATILVFMDQQITAVIINRTENKLKKGCGYHLDLLNLSFLIAINSVMGLPWFVAATVLSINHVNSLKLESKIAAPGEKPQFLGVRENRLTQIMVFLLIGGSMFMTTLLKKIPMSVLFGVFLYMGITALTGMQLIDRILITFMPAKYQPDYAFLRQVPLKRVHMFTGIQVACLVILWAIKSFKETSILFPITLVLMIGVRKVLDKVFTQRELQILDDIMPEFRKKKIHDELSGGQVSLPRSAKK